MYRGPMRRAGFVDVIGGLGSHDHICWVFDTPDEYRSLAGRFLADGLAGGLRVVFIAGWARDDELDGIDGFAAARAAGAAEVRNLGAYGAVPAIDPDAQLQAFAEMTAQAVADGFSGLRVAADTTPLLRSEAARAAFARYEFMVDGHMARQPMSAMCGYNRTELSRDAMAELAGMHPLAPTSSTALRLFAADPQSTTAAAVLAGEVDVAGYDQLRRSLSRADLALEDGTITIDARELTFLDHRGLMALVEHVRGRGATTELLVAPAQHGAVAGRPDGAQRPARGGVMRTGPATGHDGIFHEAAFYASDEEFLTVVLPFLLDGVAAGEPAVSIFGDHRQQLIRSAVGAGSGVVFIDGSHHYQRPAAAIRRHRDMLAGYVADGAAQIRVAGDVPHPGVGVPWEWWARYEAAANDVYDEFPMYGLCPYDTRIAPPEVLADVRRTHPHVVTADGHRQRSSTYDDPRHFLATAVTSWPDPVEAGPAACDLSDPSPAAARAAIGDLQRVAALGDDDLSGLLLSVSEVVTNALIHGRPPVRMRAWAEPARIVVTVTDGGPGPDNPAAGLMPAGGPGGLGLWLAHQMCAYVSLRRGPDGFTIRLVAGHVTA